MIFDPVLVLKRPKKSGLGFHFGVQFPGGAVYDITYEDGMRRLSRDQFADGEIVTVAKSIPWHMGHHVRARLEQIARNPRKYDLLNWNCETLAEYLTSGVPRSTQVFGAIFVTGLVVALLVFSRA